VTVWNKVSPTHGLFGGVSHVVCLKSKYTGTPVISTDEYLARYLIFDSKGWKNCQYNTLVCYKTPQVVNGGHKKRYVDL
jgi:hypothetical protein